MNPSRRNFIKLGTLGAATVFVAPHNFAQAFVQPPEPHFFVQIIIEGGFDWSYLTDARPLAMTQANLIQNYFNQDPTTYTDSRGGQALVTSAFQPLLALKQDFTLINGVFMAPSFDGHEQNMNYLISGNPFGGESFLPHLNQNSRLHLDGVLNRGSYFSASNTGNMVPFSNLAFRNILNLLKVGQSIEPTQNIWKFIKSRYLAQGEEGIFASASKVMGDSLETSADMQRTMKGINLENPKDDETGFLDVIASLFKNNLSRSALIIPQNPTNIDTHDPASAKNNTKVATTVASTFIKTIEYLKATPYDSTRSLFDVTTLMMTSEFSRTMRQINQPIDNTGSDHNNLTNSVLVGGKGIQSGLVLGASDFASADEVLSGAHIKMDSLKTKIMARPFDFKENRPRNDKPEIFRASDYLSINSVVNTIYKLYGVSEPKYRTPERTTTASPVITALLK